MKPASRIWRSAAAAIPVLAAVVVYLPALRNGFIWDDPLVLQQLRAFHSLRDLVVLPPIVPKFYYRPFVFLTYLFDRALAGETPYWFHASVIAWHAVNTLLVYLLATRLFPADERIAGGSALLFAVFPTHVESVAWMAGRSDVIVCTFMLLTLLLVGERERSWSMWMGGVTYLLALLSKEMAIACLVLVPLLDLLSARRLYWARYLPLMLVTVGYFALRNASVGAFLGGIPVSTSTAQLGLDVIRALGFYSVRAVLPAQLCAYIPAVPGGVGYLAVGCIVPVAGSALAARALRRGRWEPAFLVAWFFVTLAPSLTVIARRSASAVVAERYLYVPTAASCLLLAWAIVHLAARWRVHPRWAVSGLIILSLAFTTLTVPYTRVWADNLTFWSDIVAKVPDDALPHRELAMALLERGRLDDAEQHFKLALAQKSDREGRAMTYSNLGNLYRRLKRYADAEQALDAALAVAPHPGIYHNLGMTLMGKIEQEQSDQTAVLRDITKARGAFEQALRMGSVPSAPEAFAEWEPAKTHALLGQVLFSMGDPAGARTHLQEALRLQPTGPIADLTRRYMQTIPP